MTSLIGANASKQGIASVARGGQTLEELTGVRGRRLGPTWDRITSGLVVSAGKTPQTAKILLWTQRWEKKVQKNFKVPTYHLVHDPNDSVRQGDVIAVSGGWRSSSNKRMIVRHIVAPYGTPIEERSPVPTVQELLADEAAKRRKKLERRAVRDAERAIEARKLRTERDIKRAEARIFREHGGTTEEKMRLIGEMREQKLAEVERDVEAQKEEKAREMVMKSSPETSTEDVD